MTAAVITIVLIITLMTAVFLLLPRMARPTVPFGVRVPESRIDSPVIAEATRQYQHGVILTMSAVAVLGVVLATRVPYEVAVLITSLLPIGVWFVPYLPARRMVQDAKREEQWYAGVRQATATDTSLRTSPPPYPWAWAAPAILIAVASAVIGITVYPTLPDRIATNIGRGGRTESADTTIWSALGPVGVQILLTLMLLGLTAIVLRSKADLAAADPRGSADRYRRYLELVSRSIMVLAAGMNLTMLLTALIVWDVLPATAVWLIISIVPSLIGAALLLVVTLRTGQSGHRLRTPGDHAPGTDRDVADRDDDRYWIAGILYVNRDDPALWVAKRFGGVGWTMNMARPAAWLLMGLILAVAAAVPIIAVTAG